MDTGSTHPSVLLSRVLLVSKAHLVQLVKKAREEPVVSPALEVFLALLANV